MRLDLRFDELQGEDRSIEPWSNVRVDNGDSDSNPVAVSLCVFEFYTLTTSNQTNGQSSLAAPLPLQPGESAPVGVSGRLCKRISLGIPFPTMMYLLWTHRFHPFPLFYSPDHQLKSSSASRYTLLEAEDSDVSVEIDFRI